MANNGRSGSESGEKCDNDEGWEVEWAKPPVLVVCNVTKSTKQRARAAPVAARAVKVPDKCDSDEEFESQFAQPPALVNLDGAPSIEYIGNAAAPAGATSAVSQGWRTVFIPANDEWDCDEQYMEPVGSMPVWRSDGQRRGGGSGATGGGGGRNAGFGRPKKNWQTL